MPLDLVRASRSVVLGVRWTTVSEKSRHARDAPYLLRLRGGVRLQHNDAQFRICDADAKKDQREMSHESLIGNALVCNCLGARFTRAPLWSMNRPGVEHVTTKEHPLTLVCVACLQQWELNTKNGRFEAIGPPRIESLETRR